MNDKNIKDNNIKVGDTVYIIKNDKVIGGEVIGTLTCNEDVVERLGICWKIQTETQLERVYNVYTSKSAALIALLESLRDKINKCKKKLEEYQWLQFEAFEAFVENEGLITK